MRIFISTFIDAPDVLDNSDHEGLYADLVLDKALDPFYVLINIPDEAFQLLKNCTINFIDHSDKE